MKEIIKLLAIFLFTFLIILISLAVLNAIYLLLSSFVAVAGVSLALLLSWIPAGILNVLPTTLMLSVLIMFLRVSLKSAPSLITSLALALAALLFFAGGLLGVSRIQGNQTRPQVKPAEIILPRQINRYDSFVVIPAKLEYDFLIDSIVLDLNRDQWKFFYYPRALGTIQDGNMKLDFSDIVFSTKIEDPSRKYLQDYDKFSADILQAFQVFNNRFIQLAEKPGLPLLVSIFTYVFFLIASGFFSRITRWPLFNLLLYGSILTGVVLFFAFYTGEIQPELQKIMENTEFLKFIPDLALLVLSVLFILVDIIFIPRKYWKEGIILD